MKRELLDSNIYGKIIEKMEVDFVVNNLPKSNIIVYGSDVIRRELRDTPKEKIMIAENKKKKIRILLLNLYDFIVKNHQLKTTNDVKGLAEAYYIAYKKFGGFKVREDIINDFIIISTATLNKLDVIYSEDNRTMLSIHAVKSYELVNSIKKLKTPKFKSYEELKMKSARSSPNKLLYTFPYFRIFHRVLYISNQLFLIFVRFFTFFCHIIKSVNQRYKPFA